MVSLDAMETPSGTMLAWVEISLLDGERVFVATLPEGNPQPFDLGAHVPEVVRFAPRTGQAPMLIITTDTQGLIVADPTTGRLVADDHDGGVTSNTSEP